MVHFPTTFFLLCSPASSFFLFFCHAPEKEKKLAAAHCCWGDFQLRACVIHVSHRHAVVTYSVHFPVILQFSNNWISRVNLSSNHQQSWWIVRTNIMVSQKSMSSIITIKKKISCYKPTQEKKNTIPFSGLLIANSRAQITHHM